MGLLGGGVGQLKGMREGWEFIGECSMLYTIFQMGEQSQIVDLSDLNNFQILQAIEKLLEESDFSKFTLVLKRKPKQNDLLLTSTKAERKMKTKYSASVYSRCPSEYSYKFTVPRSQRCFEDDLDDNFHMGLRLYHQGQFDGALELLLQGQNQLESSMKDGVTSVKQYQDLCFHIGNCYYRMKNYDKAVQYFGRQFKGEQLKQQGQKCNNLGSCYAHLDQLRLSLNYYTQAFKIYQQFPEIDCSNLLNNIGMLYAQSSMFETAQKYFNQSIDQRKIKSPQNQFLMYCSYLQLGNCQKQLKKQNNAIASLREALKLSERGFGEETETLTQLASIYQLCERWGEALDCYERLSVLSTHPKGFLFEKAALLHRNMGHHSDHQRFIKQAYEEYQKEKNTRKLSELMPVMNRFKK